MQNSIVIKGRLTGPRSVLLDEPVVSVRPNVEVIVRLFESSGEKTEANVFDFLQRLPAEARARGD
jgi:hypothetical protein